MQKTPFEMTADGYIVIMIVTVGNFATAIGASLAMHRNKGIIYLWV